jgi:hypothetical protein
MPLWKNLQGRVSPTPQLLNLYRAVGQARSASPALRSDNHIYLNLMNGQAFDEVFSVAKFEHRNGSATTNDIVFAFVNLTAHSAQGNSPGHWFNLKQDQDNNGVNDFGIQPARLYNVKNLAAYTGADTTRAGNWLWPSPRAGSDLLQNGISVQLNPEPANDVGWTNAPYEAQFLKLYDVTPAASADKAN